MRVFKHRNGHTGKVDDVAGDVALVRVVVYERIGDSLVDPRELQMPLKNLALLLSAEMATPDEWERPEERSPTRADSSLFRQ